MIEMPHEPVPQYPDPPDPHEQCERVIERLEGDVEAARRPLSFAELHALIAALLPGETFFLSVQVHHSAYAFERPADTLEWSITYGFTTPECKILSGTTAAEVYDKLRAAVPAPVAKPNPLDEVGDLPW